MFANDYVADMTIVDLKYEDYREFSPLAASGNYVFSGNSAYDPDVTNVGRQPTGFDEWSAYYSRYRVLSSSFKVSVVALKPTLHAINFVIGATRTASALADFGTYSGLPYSENTIVSASSGMDRVTLQLTVGTRQFSGLSASMFGDLGFAAFTNGNPSERWYWQYFVESSDHLSVLLVAVVVQLTYKVQFFERIDNITSLVVSLTSHREQRVAALLEKVRLSSTLENPTPLMRKLLSLPPPKLEAKLRKLCS